MTNSYDSISQNVKEYIKDPPGGANLIFFKKSKSIIPMRYVKPPVKFKVCTTSGFGDPCSDGRTHAWTYPISKFHFYRIRSGTIKKKVRFIKDACTLQFHTLHIKEKGIFNQMLCFTYSEIAIKQYNIL